LGKKGLGFSKKPFSWHQKFCFGSKWKIILRWGNSIIAPSSAPYDILDPEINFVNLQLLLVAIQLFLGPTNLLQVVDGSPQP
jgi:hypothetical protein